MAVYSVNRRRAILLLVLTSVMLLTIDLRGNAVVDGIRSGFSIVLRPFERAANVVATPIRNAWHGATDYQELERENQRLRDQLARQRGDQLSAAAVVLLNQELMALNRIPTLAGIDKVATRVVGDAPGNFNQVVEIDHGSADSGIAVGMPVVNFAGLVGKVTKVYSDRSVVMLATDLDYAIPCKVTTLVAVTPETSVPPTTPSGIPISDLSTTTTSTSTTTTVAGSSTTVPFSFDPPATQPTSSSTPDETTSSAATTTTVPTQPVEIERGVCKGRGMDKLPVVTFVTDNPVFGDIGVGSIVSTAGGSTSLAPPDVVIGEVINVVPRAGSAGPLLEIQLAADLNQLNVLQVVLYRPPSEVPNG